MFTYHSELPIILQMVNPQMANSLREFSGGNTYLAVIITASGLFLTLLRLETSWNPLLTARDIVYKWVAIPRLVNEIVELARDQLKIKGSARRSVSESKDLGVDLGDFEKNEMTIDRAWAELCYVDWWLRGKSLQRHGKTFFSEESFSWNDLSDRFNLLKGSMATLKGTPDIANSIKQHREKLNRIAACYLVYMNSRRTALVEAAEEFGIDLGEPASANPLWYSAIYIVALVFSVYLGTYISAVLYDCANGKALLQAAADPDFSVIQRRVAFAFGDYGVPIIGVLLLRNFVWRLNPVNGYSMATTYAWILLFASVLSTVGLSVMIELFNTSSANSSANSSNFFSICQRMLRWSVGPALICLYINYYLDRQTDPCLTEIGRGGDTVGRRVLSAVLFTAFIILLTLPSIATMSPRNSALDVSKARFVALGTVIFSPHSPDDAII